MAESLAHSKWVCKYHIVFSPKYRRKIIYNQLRADIQQYIRDLCKWKGVEILEGHIMMIQDPAISEQIEAKIDGEKINAEAAVEEACDFFAQIFAMADDELTQQRASDLGDIKTRLIKILLGIEEVDISAVPEGTILVAEDLTPSMTAGINPANVLNYEFFLYNNIYFCSSFIF